MRDEESDSELSALSQIFQGIGVSGWTLVNRQSLTYHATVSDVIVVLSRIRHCRRITRKRYLGGSYNSHEIANAIRWTLN